MRSMGARAAGLALVISVTCGAGAGLAMEPESKRLARAKDFIAEEQWTRAIEELRAAARDPKEAAGDEVLFWLAHSLNQAGDAVTSLETIRQLEQRHPHSAWVKPAQSLRLEIAMRLGRDDVLWFTARPQPPAPPAPPTPPTPSVHAAPRPAPAPPAPSTPLPPAAPAVPPPPPPAAFIWIPDSYHPDADLQVQALGHLIRTDAHKAIPLLREMALEADSPGVASRAVFVLAQSGRPEARKTIVEVAQSGPSQVRVVAVRELARFGGPDAARDLMHVYSSGDVHVKRQIVRSLGERWEKMPLLTIARTETNPEIKSRAIMSLGRAGGVTELRQLYTTAPAEAKRPIILSLFNARAEDQLIHIAERERNDALRREIVMHLQLLGTPKAEQYIRTIRKDD
jgi:hypothetical protein